MLVFNLYNFSMKKYFYSAVGLASSAVFAQIDPKLELVDRDMKWLGADTTPIDAIQTFIKTLLGFLGLVMVIVCLWGGWKILTSGSQDEGKEAGKKIIINAVIGLAVIFFAWTGTNFVFDILQGQGTIGQ